MAHVEDRWTKPGPTGRRIKTDRHGKGLRWLAVWNEPDGKRRKQAFATKDAAQAHLDGVAHLTRSGLYVSPEISKKRLREISDEWLATKANLRRGSRYQLEIALERSILPHLGDVRLEDLDRRQVQAAVNEWSKEYTPKTVRARLSHLTALVNYARQERYITGDPCTKVSLPEDTALVVPMTAVEARTMAEALEGDYQRLAEFMAASGVRPGEGRSVTWDRIKPLPDGRARVRIDRQWDVKHGEWGPLKTKYSARTFTIGVRTVEKLGEPRDGFVFRSVQGQPLSSTRLYAAWSGARKQTNLLHLSGWHQYRHFHASWLISRGMSPVAVASRLGHKDATETLRTYGHLWDNEDDRMAELGDLAVL